MADRAPYADTATAPARWVEEVAPDDNADLAQTAYKGLWIGGAGNIALVSAGGIEALIENVPAGTLLPIATKRVKLTGTTIAGTIWGLS